MAGPAAIRSARSQSAAQSARSGVSMDSAVREISLLGRSIGRGQQQQEKRPAGTILGSGSVALAAVHDDLAFGRANGPLPHSARFNHCHFENGKMFRLFHCSDWPLFLINFFNSLIFYVSQHSSRFKSPTAYTGFLSGCQPWRFRARHSHGHKSVGVQRLACKKRAKMQVPIQFGTEKAPGTCMADALGTSGSNLTPARAPPRL
jgi:hypothetical protein